MSTDAEDFGSAEPATDGPGSMTTEEQMPAVETAQPVGAPADEVPADPSAEPPFTHTRASGVWASVVVSLIVLVVLIVFILENPVDVRVDFFGAHGSLALGVALLLAAVIGGLVVVLFGTARILQLRHRSRLQHRRFKAKNTASTPSQ